jgi:hypothetical protein
VRIGKTSPVFAKRADKGRYVKSGAGERSPVAESRCRGSTTLPWSSVHFNFTVSSCLIDKETEARDIIANEFHC